jgi:hypothetical protein
MQEAQAGCWVQGVIGRLLYARGEPPADLPPKLAVGSAIDPGIAATALARLDARGCQLPVGGGLPPAGGLIKTCLGWRLPESGPSAN